MKASVVAWNKIFSFPFLRLPPSLSPSVSVIDAGLSFYFFLSPSEDTCSESRSLQGKDILFIIIVIIVIIIISVFFLPSVMTM